MNWFMKELLWMELTFLDRVCYMDDVTNYAVSGPTLLEMLIVESIIDFLYCCFETFCFYDFILSIDIL